MRTRHRSQVSQPPAGLASSSQHAPGCTHAAVHTHTYVLRWQAPDLDPLAQHGQPWPSNQPAATRHYIGRLQTLHHTQHHRGHHQHLDCHDMHHGRAKAHTDALSRYGSSFDTVRLRSKLILKLNTHDAHHLHPTGDAPGQVRHPAQHSTVPTSSCKGGRGIRRGEPPTTQSWVPSVCVQRGGGGGRGGPEAGASVVWH